MLIALFGAPGAGKDTVANHLVESHGFTRVAFADKVRELAYEVVGPIDRSTIDVIGWDTLKRRDDFFRELLERVGDGTRKVISPDIWISLVEDRIMQLLRDGKDVVISDMRKANEFEMVLHHVGTAWLIHRPGFDKRPFDEWDPSWAKFRITNDGDIQQLCRGVDFIVNHERNRL
jgi:hypothetical protein